MGNMTLRDAAKECEWCELVLAGSQNIEPAYCPDGLVWIHYDGNGEQILCRAADFWETLLNGVSEETELPELPLRLPSGNRLVFLPSEEKDSG